MQEYGTRTGEIFIFRKWINGQKLDLEGVTEKVIGSREAKDNGLVKSKRSGVVLGLRVEGYADLFYEHRNHVKPKSRKVV